MNKLLLFVIAVVVALSLAGGGSEVRARELATLPDGASRQADTATQQAEAKPWLGATLADLNPVIARLLKREVDRGVVVIAVVPDGPAAKAGVKRGDLITAVNGKAVKSRVDLYREVAPLKVGDPVSLTITRDKASQTVSITLAAAPVPATGKGKAGKLPPGLEGLQGLSLKGLRDKALGWSVTVRDKNGNPLTLNGTPGKVTKIDPASITVKPNDTRQSDRSYTIAANTLIRMPRGRTVEAIRVDDEVTVVSVDKSDQATAILSSQGLLARAIRPGAGALPNLRNFPGIDRLPNLKNVLPKLKDLQLPPQFKRLLPRANPSS